MDPKPAVPEPPAVPSDEETPYDLFVSYARRDNAAGWVNALVEGLAAVPAPDGGLPLRIFFDTEEIHGMERWRDRLEGALRRSRVLLVCLSDAWCDSLNCRWEWQAFHAARAGRRSGVAQALAVVRLDLASDQGGADTGWAA